MQLQKQDKGRQYLIFNIQSEVNSKSQVTKRKESWREEFKLKSFATLGKYDGNFRFIHTSFNGIANS